MVEITVETTHTMKTTINDVGDVYSSFPFLVGEAQLDNQTKRIPITTVIYIESGSHGTTCRCQMNSMPAPSS